MQTNPPQTVTLSTIAFQTTPWLRKFLRIGACLKPYADSDFLEILKAARLEINRRLREDRDLERKRKFNF